MPDELDTSVIPNGMYCYTPIQAPCKENGYRYITKPCPYHELRDDKPYRENGYCAFMKVGDWENKGPFLLWDSCKECGINEEDDNAG